MVTGLVVDKNLTKPEITLLLHMKPFWEDILSRSAIDSWEYERLELLGWDSDILGDWLLKNERSCVPPSHAAVMQRLGTDRINSADTDFDHLEGIDRLNPARIEEWEGPILTADGDGQ